MAAVPSQALINHIPAGFDQKFQKGERAFHHGLQQNYLFQRSNPEHHSNHQDPHHQSLHQSHHFGVSRRIEDDHSRKASFKHSPFQTLAHQQQVTQVPRVGLDPTLLPANPSVETSAASHSHASASAAVLSIPTGASVSSYLQHMANPSTAQTTTYAPVSSVANTQLVRPAQTYTSDTVRASNLISVGPSSTHPPLIHGQPVIVNHAMRASPIAMTATAPLVAATSVSQEASPHDPNPFPDLPLSARGAVATASPKIVIANNQKGTHMRISTEELESARSSTSGVPRILAKPEFERNSKHRRSSRQHPNGKKHKKQQSNCWCC